MERIARTFHPKEYHSGEQVVRQGDIIKEIGLIEVGKVLLMMHTPEGKMVRCVTLNEGNFLVDAGLMISGRSMVSAICETQVLCHAQALENYLDMVGAYPKVKEFFYDRAVNELTKALEAMNSALRSGSSQGGADKAPHLFPRAVRKALVYIEKNYADPLTLGQVARINGMSKYHFSRIFKLKTGYTFKAYLNKRRIEMTKYFMEHEEMNVSEAAFAVGYNDLAYFSRVFQKQEGLPPSRYRKALEKFQQKKQFKNK